MQLGKIQDWLQIGGLLGVIGSLIFVGIQLKQTQEIALSNTYQNRTSVTVDMNTAVMTSPELLYGISKVYLNRVDELTMPEAVAVEWHVGTNLTVLENNHLQYESGFLSQEHWQRNIEELECILTIPLFREVALGWDFRQSFKEVVAGVIEKVSIDAENCWSYGWDFPLPQS